MFLFALLSKVSVITLHLSPMYPFVGTISLLSPEFFIPVIIVFIVIAAAIWSLRWTREAVFALLFFLQTGIWRDSQTLFMSVIASSPQAQAAAHYQNAMTLNPQSVDAALGMGLLHLQQNDTEGSIAQYRIAIALDPANAGAHFNLGVALERTGNAQEAERAFARALQLDPSFARP